MFRLTLWHKLLTVLLVLSIGLIVGCGGGDDGGDDSADSDVRRQLAGIWRDYGMADFFSVGSDDSKQINFYQFWSDGTFRYGYDHPNDIEDYYGTYSIDGSKLSVEFDCDGCAKWTVDFVVDDWTLELSEVLYGNTVTNVYRKGIEYSSSSNFDYSDISGISIHPMGEGFQFEYVASSESMRGRLTFQILDQNGDSVNGLTKSNYLFYEDNTQADIESYSDITAETQLKISLVLDASYSIVAANAEDAVKSAACQLLYLFWKDDLKGYRFANTVTRMTSISQLTYNESDRFTSLYDGIQMAMDDAVSAGEERVIVVFTDGNDNHSLTTLAELLESIETNNLIIHVVGLSESGSSLNGETLESIADAANGSYLTASNTEQLLTLFNDVAAKLQSIYSVSYWSPNRSGYHQLEFVTTVNNTSDSYLTMFEVTSD